MQLKSLWSKRAWWTAVLGPILACGYTLSNTPSVLGQESALKVSEALGLEEALALAGENRSELEKVLSGVQASQRETSPFS